MIGQKAHAVKALIAIFQPLRSEWAIQSALSAQSLANDCILLLMDQHSLSRSAAP